LIIAGDHVPEIPLGETVASDGAFVPAQKGAIGAKLGVTFGMTVTDIVVGVAETHCPVVGVKV
jgi:hypothetical protein